MASYTFKSSRRFNPERWVQGPNERRRYPFYTTPWGDETPSAPSIVLYDAKGNDVTATKTSDTYTVGGDSESEVVGSNVIWTRYVVSLVPGQTYKLECTFTLGGNTMIAYGWIDCQEYDSKLTQIKESGVWLGVGEKVRYQLDTRPWRMPSDMATALSLDTTLSSPSVTVFDLKGTDVTSTYTTDDSGVAPTEISDYWVRTLFYDNLKTQEFRTKVQFTLQRNVYEAWARLYGEA